MLEDLLLLIRFKRGDMEALRRIYEKYRLYLLKLATALYHDIHTAEDIVQEVFTRFAQSARTIGIDGSLKSYLRTCAVNGVRNRIRADQARGHVELSEAGAVASGRSEADRWAILNEESNRLAEALAQVPFEQREVIVLHLHGGMKFREIARLQAVSIKTIQSRYRYGLDKMRTLLNGEAH